MEFGLLSPSSNTMIISQPHYWLPPPKDCLKLNVDVSFKENFATLVVLARDKFAKFRAYGLRK